MNKIHRIVWSETSGVFVVAHEKTASRGKPSGTKAAVTAAVAGALFAGAVLAAPAPNELPTGGSVVAGTANISTSGARMDINQSTAKVAIDWNTFNIGNAAHVHFAQPSGGVALNRVFDTNASQIYGKLTATGQVFLVNPNGVLFAPGAQVDVGGLVASTLAIKPEDFMAGNYTFQGTSSNAIINQGNIKVGTGGTAALIAAKITNTGSIEAPQGTVLMGAGRKITLDMGGPVKIQVEQGALDALIEQGGVIKADGGLVYLTAKAANELTTTVINHSGITEAQTLATGEKGEVFLMGGFDHERVVVSGTLDASAPRGGDGGFIETSAAHVQIAPQVNVTTVSARGHTGTWLIDPTDFAISAGDAPKTDSGIGATTLSTALNSNNVTIQTVAAGGENGDITVDAAVTKTSGPATTLTLAAHRDISINAALSGSLGSPLNVVLASRATGESTGGVYVGADIRTYGGNITIGGGDTSASGYAITHSSTPYGDNTAGIFIDQAIIDATSDGTGSANNTLPVAAGGGNIVMRGKGDLNTAHQFNAGVYFYINKTIGVVTGGTGSITVEGYGGKATHSFWDVAAAGVLWESTNTFIKAKQGDVRIKGYAGTVADRYGIVLTDTFIGTGGYLGIEGDSLVQRGGTLNLNVGGSGDIAAPLLGLGSYSLSKTGSGILNLAGNAQNWSTNRVAQWGTSTTNTATNGTFTDASGTVNLVNLTADQALYAYSTRPSTTTVTQSAATPLSGGANTTTTTTNTIPQDTAIATAQHTHVPSITNASTPTNIASPLAPPPAAVVSEQGTLPVSDVNGGLVFVQVGAPPGTGSTTATIQSVADWPANLMGRDPMGFMRVFVVRGGLNLPDVALNGLGQNSRNDANQ